MVRLSDHPAFQVPPDNGGAFCSCVPVVPVECPTVTLEAKVGMGAFSRPGPCAFLHEGVWYLKRTITRNIVVRDVEFPPHRYECEEWWDGTTTVKILTEENVVHVPYNSLEVVEYTQNEDAECEEPPLEDSTESEYELTQFLNRRYNIASSCTGTPSTGLVPPGGFINEVDPDLSTEETTYEGEWIPLSNGEIRSRAETAAGDELASAAWGGVAEAARSITADDVGIITADVIKAETPFHITGGNTGYVKVFWAVLDEDSNVVDSGSEVGMWDPSGSLDAYVDGPLLDTPWPSDEGGFHYRTVIVTDVICLPEPE